MPVQVPFQLRRDAQQRRCDALLLLSSEMRDLLTLCERMGDPLPPIYSVAGGFLVIPDEVPSTLSARTIRLRRLSENAFLPIDAQLAPALHSGEAVDLTRQGGLVFLPGDRCLAFRPDEPLDVAALIQVPPPMRGQWQPFPEPPALADRLTIITRITPDVRPDDVFEAGAAGIGEETPRPPKAGMLKSIAGRTLSGIGKGIAGLGTALGMGGLARLGAKLIGKGMALAPWLSEALLGKQEAALRELLRKFRDGKIEEALRNALPIGGETGEGPLHQGDQLPTHDVRWSLSHLFGAGPASVWVGGGADVQRDLMEEYRKAAQAAIARGDHRRAAFIYGKLLFQPRLAADVLSQGGLHRDAAILFRDLLKDPLAAAREFEAAGEFDEALRLYRLNHDYEKAGDLLRRLGEDERAIDEYHRAAQRFINQSKDYLKAGELMLRKTGRADLAGGYFALGWDRRADAPGNAIPCAIRYAEILAFAVPLDGFWALVDEVEKHLEPAGNAVGAANFFNAIAQFADLSHLKPHREAIRDRARLALAARLREHPRYESRPGSAVAEMFGRHAHWGPALVSDAEFALRAAIKKALPADAIERPFQCVRLGYDMVTAAAYASESGDIIIGLENGEVVSFHPESGRVSAVTPSGRNPIEAIAVDSTGRSIVTVSHDHADDATIQLRSYRRDETDRVQYDSRRSYVLDLPFWYCLSPLITKVLVPRTYLSTPTGMVHFDATALIPNERDRNPDIAHSMFYLAAPALPVQAVAAMGGAVVGSSASPPFERREREPTLFFQDHEVVWAGASVKVSWRPTSNILSHPSIAWLQLSNAQFEIAGIADDGTLWWSQILSGSNMHQRSLAVLHRSGYRAVAIWRSGRVIGITGDNHVHWLWMEPPNFQHWSAAALLHLPAKAVACFPSHATREVMIIMADGDCVRVPAPA